MSFPDKTEQKHRLVQVQLFEINKIKEILNIQWGVFTSVPVTGRHFFANTFILQYFNFVSWNISSGQLSTNKIERYKQKEEDKCQVLNIKVYFQFHLEDIFGNNQVSGHTAVNCRFRCIRIQDYKCHI